MTVRLALGIGSLVLLMSGCELLPHQDGPAGTEQPAAAVSCRTTEPSFEEDACLLHAWVAYGLTSQRGDAEWRRQTLESLNADQESLNADQESLDADQVTVEGEWELMRAVVLSWGTERQWREASELYQAHTHAAPADLQPLLRYWRNELEGRRSLASQNSNARARLASLENENGELADKLEALTAIERNINLRQQSP